MATENIKQVIQGPIEAFKISELDNIDRAVSPNYVGYNPHIRELLNGPAAMKGYYPSISQETLDAATNHTTEVLNLEADRFPKQLR